MRFFLLGLVLMAGLLGGCSKWNLTPKELNDGFTPVAVTLDPVGTSTTNSAQVQCQISNASNISLKAYGVVYATTNDPTINNSKVTVRGTSGALVTVTLSGLQPKTTYYYRAYGTNTEGITAYGASKSFSTADPLAVDMVNVTGGTFSMGSNDGETDEKPVHNVTVKNFSIGKYEVTNREYLYFCTQTSRDLPQAPDWGRPETYPVVNVSYADATAYCQWLSQKSSKTYRLPTEAEWEYAARGGNQSKNYIYSGSNTANDVAWYSSTATNKTPYPVGLKQPNELGIYDMSGNAAEWCSDWYDSYPEKDLTDPTGPGSGRVRVIRASAYDSGISDIRIANRGAASPDLQARSVGFRLVQN